MVDMRNRTITQHGIKDGFQLTKIQVMLTNPQKIPNFEWIDSLKVVNMDVTRDLVFPEQLKFLSISDSTVQLDSPVVWNVESLALQEV
jgi:hypothetical protein